MGVGRRRWAAIAVVCAALAAVGADPVAASNPPAVAPDATDPPAVTPTTAAAEPPPTPHGAPTSTSTTSAASGPSAPDPADGPTTTSPRPSDRPPGDDGAAAGEIDEVADAVPGEYIVTLSDTTSADAVEGAAADLADAYDGDVLFTYEHALEGFAVAMDEADALALSGDPRVAAVEENGVVHAFAAPAAVPAATQSDAPWNLDRIDQRDLPLDGAYTARATGAGVHAYIIDSGLRTTHADFSGRATIGTDTLADGQNGVDCNGHGTHVAGVLGGETWGAAKDVRLVGVRVLDCNAQGTNASVIAGVDWVTAHHESPAVANMSLGGSINAATDAAVQRSIDAGVTYVLAAGNSTTTACNVSPARVGDALTVGYTDSTDARATLSNLGACLDLFAPGQAITSTWYTSDTATKLEDGSSGAAPHVAGVVAQYLEDRPDASPAEVTQAVHDGATPGHVTNPGTGSPNLLLYGGLVPDGAVLTLVSDQRPDDPVDVTYSVCPDGGGACQTVVLDDDRDPAHPRVANVAVTEGTAYTVTREALAGWDLTDLTCNQGEVDLAARQATVTLGPGQHATCRFTNEAATLTLVTDAVPGSAQDFPVEVCGPAPAPCQTVALDDDYDGALPDSTRLSGIVPGGYDLTSAPVAGWDLTSLSCTPTGGGDVTDLAGGRAHLEIAPHEQVTCTFVNTQRATLTVVADTVPDGPQDLGFTVCTPASLDTCTAGSSSFSLDDDTDPALPSQVSLSRPPGQYLVALDPLTDWGIDTLTCTTTETIDVGRRRVIAELTAGEATTCTFTVRQGSLAIVQDTAPDAAQDFTVHACPVTGPCQDVVLDDDADPALPATTSLDGLAPGVWTLTQDAVAGYGLVGLTCTRGAVDLTARQATLVVLAGQRTTCTFLDRATTLTVVQDTVPDGPQDFTVHRCPADGACTDVVLDDDPADATRARTAVAAGLDPGTYSLIQAPVEGWGLAQLTCDTGEVVDRAARTATVVLAAGDQTTCTFTNRATSLSVQLDALPEDPHDVTVSACRAGGACVDAVLDDDPADATRAASVRWDGLAAGDWTVTPSGTAGWGRAGLSCTSGKADLATATASVHLDDGEQVSCTVTERRTSLTIVQNTAPDGPQDFTFAVCPDDGGACTDVVLDDDTDPARADTAVIPAAAPGVTYTLTQAAVDRWALSSLTCDGGETRLAERQAEVNLAAGEQRTCTFATTQASLTVVNDTVPNSAVDVGYTVCAGSGGAGGCHPVTLDDDGDATLPREATDGALDPGLYTVTQEPVAGHALTRLFCTHGLTSLPTRTATVTVRPGDHVQCTFTVEPTRIFVSQDTQPNGPQDFAFIGCSGTGGTACGPFVLDDDAASTDVPGNTTASGLAAITYTITQRPVDGYGLISITCSGGGAVVDLAGGTVTLDLDPGILVSCTFVNRPTSLTIVHDAQPDSSVDVAYQGCLPAFGPTACGTPFLLDDDTDPTLPSSTTASGLPAGTFTVTQTAPASLPLTDLTCTAGRVSVGSRRATVALEPGEQVTCTFVNGTAVTPVPASLVLVQDTVPDGPQDFAFATCSGPGGATGCLPVVLDDDADATLPRTVTYPVDPGTEYTITQEAVSGYGLTALTCSSGEVERSARRVTVEPRAGEQITCTFVVRATSLTIVEDTTPDVPQDFTFTGCAGPGGARGCGTIALDDDADATLPRTVTAAGLLPDTYTVTQAETAGYGLNNLACTATSQVSVARRRAVVRLTPGDQVTCTFTARATTLKITQDTAPNDPQDLTFDGCGGPAGPEGCSTFSLDDDTNATLPSSVTYTALPTATYTITQRAVPGYGVTAVSCTKGDLDLGARRVAVALEPGDQVTCTFTTAATSLTIIEDSAPNDAQDVAFTTCGPHPASCVGSILDDDSDAGRSNKAILTALEPGTYAVEQAALEGWGLTGLTCTGGEADVGSRRAEVTLSPGEQVTCTFVTTRTSLTLVQDTVPNSVQDVAFQVCDTATSCVDVLLDDDTDATLPATRTLAPLAASTWTVTQSAIAGYALDTLACTGGEADVGSARAVVALSPGEQVTCTFTLRLTSLTVVVDAQPNDAQDFGLTRCGAGSCATLTLDDDSDATLATSAALSPAPTGTYTVALDTTPTGWAVTAVTCTTTESVDVRARRVTVDLAPGEQVTCTFAVTRTTLTVVVDTVANAARDIPLAVCPNGGGCTSFNLDDDSDATLASSRTFPALTAGRYTLTQLATAGPPRTTITCTTGETVDLAARRVTVDLAAGEATTCTFTNFVPSITIVLHTIPYHSQDFTYSLCSQLGCGAYVLDDDLFAVTPSSVALGDLLTQTYVITQDAPSGFTSSSISCTTAEDVDIGARRVTVRLSSWEQVTCTFTNVQG